MVKLQIKKLDAVLMHDIHVFTPYIQIKKKTVQTHFSENRSPRHRKIDFYFDCECSPKESPLGRKR